MLKQIISVKYPSEKEILTEEIVLRVNPGVWITWDLKYPVAGLILVEIFLYSGMNYFENFGISGNSCMSSEKSVLWFL